MTAIDLNFSSRGHQLHGTLLLPQVDNPPAAVLLSGSGPIDRDSNMKRQKLNVMNAVAEHLAAAGIASYRYDKRGTGASGGDYRSTGLFDNIADAGAAVDALHARPEIDSSRVVIIGHSEGAIIATELAAGSDALTGAVLLAGPSKSGEAVMHWQAREISKVLPLPAKVIFKILRKDFPTMQAKRLERLKASEKDVIRIQFIRINAKWFREFLAHDPTPALRRARVPILAITGAKDIQVDPADIAEMRRIVPTAFTGEVLADVTHLLRRDEGPPSLKTYKKQMKRPLARQLLEMVSSWINTLPTESEEETDEAV